MPTTCIYVRVCMRVDNNDVTYQDQIATVFLVEIDITTSTAVFEKLGN